MLDDRQDSRRDESRGAHDAACTRQLADLDRGARAADLDAATCPLGLDDVLASRTVAGVDQNLDKISLCHTDLIVPNSA